MKPVRTAVLPVAGLGTRVLPATKTLQRRIDPHPFVPGDPAERLCGGAGVAVGCDQRSEGREQVLHVEVTDERRGDAMRPIPIHGHGQSRAVTEIGGRLDEAHCAAGTG